MQAVRLTKKKELKKFIRMADALYRGDKYYTPYMRADLLHTLETLTAQGDYTAIAVEDGKRYVARLIVTVAHSKNLGRPCGYFSHFESIDSDEAVRVLFDEAKRVVREMGADYLEGTYFPFDQDNRRGILVEGFDSAPMILTSYNPPYYGKLLKRYGFHKDRDAVSYKLDYTKYDFERIARVTEKVMQRYGLYVSHADFSNLDREIEDVHEVIAKATTDVIFQEAPTREDIARIVKNWRTFLWEDYIHIVRRKEDDRPVGVMMSVPDYFTVFRKMKGHIDPVSICKMLYYKRRITSVRAMLQYVIPSYQNKGVNFILYDEFYKTSQRHGIVGMEAGTIMEDNLLSRRNVERASGVLNKVYRIYGMEI